MMGFSIKFNNRDAAFLETTIRELKRLPTNPPFDKPLALPSQYSDHSE